MASPLPPSPDDEPTSTPSAMPHPVHVHNELTGDVHGPSIQAGSVTGGIHVHLAPASLPAPPAVHDSGIRRTLRILVGWGLALTLLFVGCGFLSYFINISVGQGSLSRNLAADAALLLLVLTFLAVRWKRVGAAEMSFLAYFGKLLTRCTPKSVTATPTRTLSAVAGTVIVLLVTFLATPATSSEFTVAQGRNGVLIIFAALGCLVGNALVVRWRNRPR